MQLNNGPCFFMFIKEHSTEAKKTDMHVSQYVMNVLSVNVMGLVDLVFINKLNLLGQLICHMSYYNVCFWYKANGA